MVAIAPTTKRAVYELTEFKAVNGVESGEFTAIVSVFNNVDLVGDRVLPDAFTKNLAAWAASGDPIPVIWSHDWQDPYAHIGYVTKAIATPVGLQITGKNDVDTNPFAAQVHKLLVARRVTNWSFAYEVISEKRAKDGANDLIELTITEVGPTLKGANPSTDTLTAKALLDAAALEAQTKVEKPMSLSGRKIWVNEGIEDTFEDTQEDIREAAIALFNPSAADNIYVSVTGTFPDHAIIEVSTRGEADDEYYDVPWKYGADGETVELGTPAPVEITVTVTPAADDAGKSMKAGRRLSTASEAAMKEIIAYHEKGVQMMHDFVAAAADDGKNDAGALGGDARHIEANTKSGDVQEPLARTFDSESLELRSRIEEMRATRKAPSGNDST